MDGAFTPKQIHDQVAKILAGKNFSRAERLGTFLTFVVRQHLTNGSEELKEYSIGLAVFGKAPDFDPAKDAIVRSTASRLRRNLAEYYEAEGKDDPILIDIPLGHYVPRFTARASESEAAPSVAAFDPPAAELNSPDSVDQPKARRRFPGTPLWAVCAVLAILVVAALLMVSNGKAVTASLPSPAKPPRLLAEATSEGRTPLRINTGHSHEGLLISSDQQTLYAMSVLDGMVSVIGTRDLQVKRTFDLPRPVWRAVLSRNGKHLYAIAQTPHEGVTVIDAETGKVIEVIPTGAPVFDISVTADERKLYLAMLYAGLKRIDLRTRETRQLSPLACPWGLELDPARRRLYVAYRCGGPGGRPGHDSVEIYNTDSDQSVGVIKDLPLVGQHHAISESGETVLLDGGDACVSPVYDHIGCTAVPDHGMFVWDALNSRLIAPIPPFLNVSTAAFLSPGNRIVLAGAHLTIWDWARQKVLENLSLPNVVFNTAVMVPELGRMFASIWHAQGLLVFDAETRDSPPPLSGLANSYGGDGTLDDSQAAASLLSESPPSFAPGRIGQAFRFDGKDTYLQGIAGRNFCTYCVLDWTESFLMKVESLSGEMTFIERDSEGRTARRLYKSRDNYIVLKGDDLPAPSFSISSLLPVQAGRWYHVAVVAGENEISLYLDGTLQGKMALRAAFSPASDRAPTFIGASKGRRSVLNGLMDELAIYNRALSPSEVRAIAAAGTR